MSSCPMCGVLFEPRKPNQRFCSKLCKDRWHNKHDGEHPYRLEVGRETKHLFLYLRFKDGSEVPLDLSRAAVWSEDITAMRRWVSENKITGS
jgi:hypothetical protein